MFTFRKTLMATTVLAGFAIFALDAAQAGPNGGPSLGSISGFSSMRMDFNRVGGPGRMLARDALRVVPLNVVKKTEKSKDTKNTAKKGTDFARLSNPKPAGGGKGKESLGNQSGPRIPAPLAELYRVTGGNLDDISHLAELASWLKTGLPVAGNPFLPQQGNQPFALPEDFGQGGRQPSGGDKSESRYWGLNGWFGTSGAPGGADSSKTGWAAGDAWNRVSGSSSGGTSRTVHYNKDTDSYWIRTVTQTFTGEGESQEGTMTTTDRTVGPNGSTTTTTTKTHFDENGDIDSDTSSTTTTRGTATDITDEKGSEKEGSEKEDGEKEQAENEKDSQPVAEGTGRPGRSGWCSPTGGCVTGSVVKGPQVIPASAYETPQTRSQLPSWATDPCPDCTSRGGGRYSGFDPRNEGGGDVDGEGGRRTPM